MSYILDALRKAEAERERGGVAAVHAPTLPLHPATAAPRAARAARLRGLLLGAVLTVAAGAAWQRWGGDALRRVTPGVVATPQTASAAGVGASAAAAAQPASAAALALAAAPQAAASEPRQVGSAAAAAPVAVHKPAHRAKPSESRGRAPSRTADTAKDRSPAASPKPTKTAPRVAEGKANAKAASTAPEAPARLPGMAELPAELRRQLPPLAVGGSVYSPQPSARMVIVNGQVFHEGSQLTPELTLEQIRPKAAVLSIRGTRFELPL